MFSCLRKSHMCLEKIALVTNHQLNDSCNQSRLPPAAGLKKTNKKNALHLFTEFISIKGYNYYSSNAIIAAEQNKEVVNLTQRL